MSEYKERLEREKIRGRLVSILSEVSGFKECEILDDMNFHDLRFDSLDLINLDNYLTDEFGFDLQDLYDSIVTDKTNLDLREDRLNFGVPIENVTNVGDVICYVQLNLP